MALPNKISEKEERQIFLNCSRFLTDHPRKRPQELLAELTAAVQRDEFSDFYGKGDLIENFEKQIAKILGKEAAVFMPSGTMAQPIALRIWSDLAENKKIGLHPTSHLENHEQYAYKKLHNLSGCLLGQKERVLALADLQACREKLAAVIIELPHRELGGVMPSWAELLKMSEWCKEHDVRFHLDGARLWESAPFYGRDYSEICRLFDSAYVSFYKGLGGMAGAILAGPTGFINDARIWQRRQGGNLITLLPYVISARHVIEQRLARMGSYYERAVSIAKAIRHLPGLTIQPEVPQSNMMHLLVRADLDKLERAFLETAAEKKIALFRRVQRIGENYGKLEFSVGESTMDFSADEIAGLLGECLEKASI